MRPSRETFSSAFVAVWSDADGLPRAWGASETREAAEARADLERHDYLERRPSADLTTRTTYKRAAGSADLAGSGYVDADADETAYTAYRYVVVQGDETSIRALTYDHHDLLMVAPITTGATAGRGLVACILRVQAGDGSRAGYLATYQADRYMSSLGISATVRNDHDAALQLFCELTDEQTTSPGRDIFLRVHVAASDDECDEVARELLRQDDGRITEVQLIDRDAFTQLLNAARALLDGWERNLTEPMAALRRAVERADHERETQAGPHLAETP